MAIDLSTAILALAENGDLQRIHDKWLLKSSCTMESAELESDRLHLKSFWGLFLICGIACSIALFIYFMQIMHQLRTADPPDAITSEASSGRSRPLHRFLSLMDEKEDPSKSKSKRAKVERSSFENDRDEESGRHSNQRQTELATIT